MNNTTLQSSFRGVPFFVESNNQTNGRILAIHKIPGRDDPYIADLGRKNRPFSINGRVIGDDYITQLKNLQAASEISGPGQLIDTDFGTKMVVCESFSLTTTDAQRRLGRFSFSFIEYTGSEKGIVQSVDSKNETLGKSKKLKESALSKFKKNYDVVFKPLYLVEKTLRNVRKTLSTIKSKLFIFNAIDEFNYILNNIVNDVNAILSTPQELADSINSLFSVPTGVYSIMSKIDDFLSLFDSVEVELIPKSTSNGSEVTVTYESKDEFNLFVKAVVLANIAELIIDVEFETYNDAVYYNEKIKNAIESFEPIASDEIYENLYALKTAIGNDLSTRFIDYPRLSTVVLNEPTPSIIVAYQLYGSIDKADEIVSRNKIVHPGFIPAGVPIKVVSVE